MTQDKHKQTSRTTTLLTGILVLTLGIVLIVCNKMITGHGIIVLAGILFLLTGIVNLVLYVTRRGPDGQKTTRGTSLFFGWLVSIAAILLGMCMLVFTDTFTAMVPFIFGILVFFGAAILILMMTLGVRKIFKVPGWLWVFPCAMIALGIVIITRKAVEADRLIMILTGSSMIVFGLTGMIIGAIAASLKHNSQAVVKSEPTDDTKDEKETVDVTPKQIEND